MKKHGFTLAEVLISLGIVGVIAAMTVPALFSSRPDERKATVLKTHKIFSEAISEILDDTSLYPENCLAQEPYIACNSRPLKQPYNVQRFENKGVLLAQLLWERLDVRGPSIISNDVVDNGIANIKLSASERDIPVRFIYGGGPGDANNPARIVIEFPRKDFEPNLLCNYGQSNCTVPRRFIFNIDGNGRLSGRDALTKAYLRNPLKLNDRDHDFAVAKQILEDEE